MARPSSRNHDKLLVRLNLSANGAKQLEEAVEVALIAISNQLIELNEGTRRDLPKNILIKADGTLMQLPRLPLVLQPERS